MERSSERAVTKTDRVLQKAEAEALPVAIGNEAIDESGLEASPAVVESIRRAVADREAGGDIVTRSRTPGQVRVVPKANLSKPESSGENVGVEALNGVVLWTQ